MRHPLAAASLLVLVSCAAGTTAATQSAAPPDARAWIAGKLPDGFEIVSADEQAGVRRVGYAPAGEREPQVMITATLPGPLPAARGRDPRGVRVRGHDATLSVLTDEGHTYGFEVVWNERDDLRLAVEGSNGPTEQQTLSVADDVHGMAESDWQRLLVELSLDTYVGRVDPTATPVDVVHGSIAGSDYVLTVLVPGGYPLGPEDRRLDCFHLTFRGEATKDQCPGHPMWTRVRGQLFVFGDVPADVARVRIGPSYGSSFPSFVVDGVAPGTGPSVRFYVAPLPEGACAVSADDADGQQRAPGVTGPLTEAGDDYSRCIAAMNASTPGGAPTAPPASPPPTPTSIN